MHIKFYIFILLGLCIGAPAQAESSKEYLFHDPSISRTQIAFTFGGDIWIVQRNGRELHRLTGDGHNIKPIFSPDGSRLVFTKHCIPGPVSPAERSGGLYVMNLESSEVRQLTYHPRDIAAIGWTADAKRILFASRRTAFTDSVVQLFSIPAEGGFAARLPLSRAAEGSISADASRIAYVPFLRFQPEWKGYRGGQTTPIWIANLADSRIEAKIPRENSNDSNPLWVGDTIYFLSDRNGPVTLFAYDLKSHRVEQVLKNNGLDLKSAAASDDAIVYEQFGSLHLFDLKSRKERRLDLHPVGDFPQVRPHAVTIEASQMRFAGLSPSGDRALMAARGDIFTLPTGHGSVTNVTGTQDVVEIDPAWSADGHSIAYFSDESGEYALHIGDTDGRSAVRKLILGAAPAFYYSPVWSPDARKIAYTDQRLNYWYVDLERGVSARVDTDLYVDPANARQMAWSPDSQWIAYTRQLPSHFHAVFIYSIDQRKSYQLTDGNSDALHVAFDKNGQYLYFTASTDIALHTGWVDISSLQHPVTRAVYAFLLAKSAVSPLLARSDQEIGTGTSSAKVPARLAIDVDDASRRIVALPIAARNYYDLVTGASGDIYLTEGPQVDPPQASEIAATIRRFDLRSLKEEEILHEVTAFPHGSGHESSLHISLNGLEILYAKHGQWYTAPADRPDGEGRQPLRVDEVRVEVNPRAEWRHMFGQAWRAERDFFYDPNLHGLDLEATRRRYKSFLQNLVSREDLNDLFREMLANLSIGHLFAGGGDLLKPSPLKVALFGADYAVEHDRYRFERIHEGDTWNPDVRAPLSHPDATVHAGEYLLAVDGREIRPTADVYSYFVGTVGKELSLTVGPNPDGRGSRELIVLPLEDEMSLRQFTWLENNRRTVDRLTGGRVAYVYLTNTSAQGLASFNRAYFSQVGRDAVIVDERFGGGGQTGDFFIDYLNRARLSYWHTRFGRDFTAPQESIFGPKVLLINEMQGSGADGFAWMFRQAGIGSLIGHRTMGALVGYYTSPGDLLDGGYLSTPNLAFYNPNGTWDIENHGVSPDIEVEDDPKEQREGLDAQLEKGIEVVLGLLENPAAPAPQHPPYPRY
jgi:tricorn protease